MRGKNSTGETGCSGWVSSVEGRPVGQRFGSKCLCTLSNTGFAAVHFLSLLFGFWRRAFLLFGFCFLFSSFSFATPYTWGYGEFQGYPTAYAACEKAMSFYEGIKKNLTVGPYSDVDKNCAWLTYYPFDGGWYSWWPYVYVHRYGDSCPADATADCDTEEQKGVPPALSCVGNPINIAIGNKFETEEDYRSKSDGGGEFVRYYNSVDGLWHHTYSTHLTFAIDKWTLVQSDGREHFFNPPYGVPRAGGAPLNKVGDGWTWLSDEGESYGFDASGRLTSLTDTAGAELTISYTDKQATVLTQNGQQLTFTEDAQYQPLSFSAGTLKINYTYNANQRLVQVNREDSGVTTNRQYLYEDSRNNGLLTGIVDERGVRFATWAYDNQWRAISSEHAGGAQKTQVTYNNADGSRTVTNELGKNTTYRFVTIGKIKRVSAIEGEPSPNCSASNSSYTYNDLGQMLTKTDAQGLVTTYSYNSRGLETSRTEASGTPLARTTTTEWDPTRFLKTKVIEPTRTTVYTYDAQGRPLSQQTTSN